MNCTIQKLLVLCTSKNDFALFHMNVRSLSLHFDELVSNLASLNINFDVIGMSETWNSFANSVKMNFEIPGFVTSHASHIVKMVVLRFI